jgi:2-(1,2-epoxy-1,2-dihydrophenyl)acetyl-CoA isomerase
MNAPNQTPTVGCVVDGPVATLTLQRPQAMNAINTTLRRELLAAMRQLDTTDGVRVVVLQAAGAGFCAGNDLKEPLNPAHRNVEAMILAEYQPILDAMAASSRLYVGAVHGTAAGIGMSIALNCDLLWMSEGACLYPAFAPIALVPDGGATWQLVQAMGYRRALQVLIEGRRLPAAQCLSVGLANGVAADDGFQATVRAQAQRLAELAPLAVQHTKRLARAAVSSTFAQTVRDEAAAQNLTFASADCREAVAVFFTHRQPRFTGQ